MESYFEVEANIQCLDKWFFSEVVGRFHRWWFLRLELRR